MSDTKPRRWNWVQRLAAMLLVGYVLWCGALYFLQNSLIYPGTRLKPTAKESYRLQPGEVEAEVGANRALKVYLLPPVGWVEGGAAAPVVVYFHGNYELAQYGLRTQDTTHFRKAGYWVAIPEYRGYAGVPGSPSEAGIVADMVEVMDWLKAQPGVNASGVVYYGRSIGGGVAVATAAQRPPRALMLRSVFTSVTDMAARFVVPSWIIASRYENLRVLPRLDMPVLVAHAKGDEIIPFAHGERVLKATRRGEGYFTEGTHDVYADEAAFRARMTEFLAKTLAK